MMIPCRFLLWLVVLGMSQFVLAANNEIQDKIEPASYTAPVALPPTDAAVEVLFSLQAAQVGDRVAQSVDVDLQMQTSITQAGQQANQSEVSLKRRQQRFIEVLEVVEGRVRRAQVTFPLCRVTTTERVSSSKQGNPEQEPEQEVVQAVEKKSYLVTRQGEQLLVTEADGGLPTKAEFEIVLTSLQNLGLPNPLMKFLLGRTIQVGERLQLPLEIAEQMMGFGEQLGKVEQFELELKSVQQIDGQPCAVFASTIEAVGKPVNPIRIRAFGQLVIQTATCRTVRAELSGPLTLSTVERTPQGSFQYSARGNMHVAIESQYGHARK